MKIRENLGVVLLVCLISKIFVSEYTLLAELLEPLYAPNLKDGIEWGTELSQMPNMKLIKTGITSIGEIEVYENIDDTLNYNGIEFNSIEYGFNNGELIFVAYKSSGIDNWTAFKKVAIENYGAGFVRHESKRYNNYIWRGRQHTVTLEYDKITRSSILFLASIL